MRAQKNTAELAHGLTGLLADSYSLYNATQMAHWNLRGPQFFALHEAFEKQYDDLAEANDMIAERIRALGFVVEGSLEDVQKRSRVQASRAEGKIDELLDHLITGHQQIVHRLRELQSSAENVMDEATMDLLIERLRVHEKTLWMLRSQRGDEAERLAEARRLKEATA